MLGRKNELGDFKLVAGNMVQRWNDRIFKTTHTVENGQDYYEIEAAAIKYFLDLKNYTEYQLYLNEPNETTSVNIRFNGKSLNLQCLSDDIAIGGLLGKVHCYTLDISTGIIWTDNFVDLQLVKQEVENLKDGTTIPEKAKRDSDGNIIKDHYATKTEMNGKQSLSEKGVAGGYPPLGENGLIPSAYVPNTFDDILEFDTYALLLTHPNPIKNTLYVVLVDETSGNNHSMYRWSGSIYMRVHDELSAAEVKILYESNPETNAFTDSEKVQVAAAETHRTTLGNPHQTSFEEILGKPTTAAGFGLTDVFTKEEVTNMVAPYDQVIADAQESITTMEQSVENMLAALTIVYDL